MESRKKNNILGNESIEETDYEIVSFSTLCVSKKIEDRGQDCLTELILSVEF